MVSGRDGHDGLMSTAPVALPPAGAVRSVVAWCRDEVVTLAAALLVAGFLLVTPTPAPLEIVDPSGYRYTYYDLPLGPATSALWVVAGMCVVAGVLLARRSPLVGTVLTTLPFFAVLWWQTFVWGWLLGTIAVAVVAATVSWRRAIVPYAAAVVVAAAYCSSEMPAILPIGFVTAGSTSGSRSVVLVVYLVAITAAVALSAGINALGRARRKEIAAAAQETQALHRELVVGERAQVARDLHDVVAHHVSLVAVRAESAPYQHPGMGDEARAVLAEIAEDARQALGELRQVLVVLQRAEGGDPASRAPQPEASDVDELVLSARSAGQQVEVDGSWGAVPAAQGYVLYRAVQEGLTNARRHAPQSAVALTRTRAGTTTGFTMTNTARHTGPVEPGRGIVGMRERVESLGGSMSTAVVDGRFELAVTLPVSADTDALAAEVGA